MRTRIITGVILIILALAMIFMVSAKTFASITAALWLVVAWEWFDLSKIPLNLPRYIAGLLTLLALMFVWWRGLAMIVPVAAVIWLWLCVEVIAYQKHKSLFFTRYQVPKSILAFILIPAAWLSMLWLWQASPWVLLSVLIVVWSMDSFAYFSGKAFGKHKLISNVSPKKTWEGVIGGLIMTLLVSIVLHSYIIAPILHMSLFPWLLAVFFTAVISVFGDLFESVLKRVVNYKDSGHFLPGHGGLYDRLDALLAALPFMYLLLLLVK